MEIEPLKIQYQKNQIVIYFQGRLDTSNALNMEKQLSEIFERQEDKWIIDCEELLYISSSGLRIFLIIIKKGEEKNKKIVVRNVSPAINEIFHTTGFLNILNIE